MSGAPPRKIPRIISRTKPKGRIQQEAKEDKTPDGGQEALVKELSKEKIVVKDGCLVSVQHIDKGQLHGIVDVTPNRNGGRRVVIDIPMVDPETEPYTENPLPGLADQIESYPCQYCPEMVFLTQYGLERHAKQKHKENFQVIMEDIEKIQKEWGRREKERIRLREKAMLTKARHENFANNAMRIAQRAVPLEDGTFSNTTERFEACKICNILINVRHPTAMEHHLRAHKKNEELKHTLLETYGEDMVNRLTCHECHLVFTDSQKLDQHTETTHTRKRKFVCKYCGHLCGSMGELNGHKAEIHAITSNNTHLNSNAVVNRNGQLMTLRRPQNLPSSMEMAANFGKDVNFSRLYRSGHEESVCSTQCAECGLRLVRPSLLVRHMLRVHNKSTFSCEITTRGLPNIRIEVVNTKIYWWCCSQRFIDRHEFYYHRRQEHLDSLISSLQAKEMQDEEPRIYTDPKGDMSMQPGTSSYNADLVHAQDGTYQVVLPEGLSEADGQIYVLIPEEEENKDEYIENNEEMSEINDEIQEEEETIHEEIVEDIVEDYHLTNEQYEQLRVEYGDELCDMIVYVNHNEIEQHHLNAHLGIEEVVEEELEEEVIEHQVNMVHDKVPDELTEEEIFEP